MDSNKENDENRSNLEECMTTIKIEGIVTCAQLHKAIDFKLLSKIRISGLEEIHYAHRLGSFCKKNPWNLNSGKCTAIVRFKVNRPINIESYGFFGPFDAASHGKYHVDIGLLTEEFLEIAGTTQLTPILKHSIGTFRIKFDNGVPILPCIWYIARFSILGPPTGQSSNVLSTVHVPCGDFGSVKFTFDVPDSNQLPEIGFTLRA